MIFTEKSLAPTNPFCYPSGMQDINETREDGADVYITLTQGQVTVVDKDVYDRDLKNYTWHAHWRGNAFYAARKEYGNTISMHRQILQVPDGLDGDHIDMNTLNNRKTNLRVSTRSQNVANSNKRSNNTSGFKGVKWNATSRAWGAHLGLNNARLFLGYFNTPAEAAQAYNSAAKEHFGEFARLNEIDPQQLVGLVPRAPHHNTTGFPGVTWNKQHKKFRARVGVNYKRIWLGDFNTAEEAAQAIKVFRQQQSKGVPVE